MSAEPALPPPPRTLRVQMDVDGWTAAFSHRWPAWLFGRSRLTATVTHLVVQRGRSVQRVPWAQVDTPTIHSRVDYQLDGAHGMERTIRELRIRWTSDGREAAFAHQGTPWERHALRHGSPEALEWLVSAIEHAKTKARQRKQAQAFDAAIEGRAGDHAREQLEDLMGGKD